MIKFKQGYLVNSSGVQKDIVVKSTAPNTLKDALIGGGIALIGIVYLTVTAFVNGAKRMEAAEFETMEELGIID